MLKLMKKHKMMRLRMMQRCFQITDTCYYFDCEFVFSHNMTNLQKQT